MTDNVIPFKSKEDKDRLESTQRVLDLLVELTQAISISLSEGSTDITVLSEEGSSFQMSVDKMLMFVFDGSGTAFALSEGEEINSIEYLHIRDYVIDMQGEE